MNLTQEIMTNYEKEIEEVKNYVKHKFSGMKRLSGDDMFLHSFEMADILSKNGYNFKYQEVALLHDIIEDTDVSLNSLKNDLPFLTEDVLLGVESLTRYENQTLIESLIKANNNKYGKVIKGVDRLQNAKTTYKDKNSQEFITNFLIKTVKFYIPFLEKSNNVFLKDLTLEIYRLFTFLNEKNIEFVESQLTKEEFQKLINFNPNKCKIFKFKYMQTEINLEKQFLYKYLLYYTNKVGKEKLYEMISRHQINCIDDIGIKSDAIMIVPINDKGELLLLKEFRMGVNKYIYNFPAGIIENNENEIVAAKRELEEETGLKCIEILKVLPPAYSSAGMTDEKVIIVFMKVSGNISIQKNEDNEDIFPVFMNKNEIKQLLKNSDMGGKTQLICDNFVNPIF